MDIMTPKSGSLEKFRITRVWLLLKYLLDADSDPQITQITKIPRTLYRECIRDRSKVTPALVRGRLSDRSTYVVLSV
jgi:hypothetical protein